MDEIEELIQKYALQNAIKYGTPRVDAVIKKLLGEHPEFREDPRGIYPIVEGIVKVVSSMKKDEIMEKLRETAPELMITEKKKEKCNLPDLEIDDGVIMRFAPNPNGAPTLGSVRGIIINSEYAKRYGGKFILRFDDTDPKMKKPMIEAYDWYIEDCEWLDAKPDEIVIASERIDLYYEYAKELIGIGGAYVCFCSAEEFKRHKDAGVPCPHREMGVEESVHAWEDMLDGVYDEKEAVLRVKTDMSIPNPALRDWVAFRIIYSDHPRIGGGYIVWPMLDFESAVEDHLLGITHIIRGKDLRDSEYRQRFLYDHLGWGYPRTCHWGRVKILEFGKFSTSSLRRRIENGEYDGWDDPRLPTLRALRRRGIHPESIRNFILDLGINEVDISLSMDNLYAENRKVIDPIANRYFFVWNPLKMEIDKNTVAKVPFHPKQEKYRRIDVHSAVYVCKEDIEDAEGEIRLKNLYNIKILDKNPLKARFTGDDTRGLRIIHWVPTDAMRVKVITPDGEVYGIGERAISKEIGNVVQFERFGFVRIDSMKDDMITAYFAHR